MERLTKYSNDIIRNKAINIIRKLSERNGLNGDELAVVSAFCLIERTENRVLKEYEDLEEQGKLLKLEDKYQKIMIGQEIFVIEDGDVKPRKICRINEWWNDYHGFQGEYAAIPSKCFGSWEFKYEDFGKTVFLAREEAEAALEELERGKE